MNVVATKPIIVGKCARLPSLWPIEIVIRLAARGSNTINTSKKNGFILFNIQENRCYSLCASLKNLDGDFSPLSSY